MADKRRSERFEIVNFVQYKPGFFSGECEALTRNVSLKGVCFLTEKKIKPGTIVSLKLHYGPQTTTRMIKAKIVYSNPSKDEFGEGFFNGAQFLD